MLTLSSLLVQRGVASMRAVEEAIARQVLHGGDLATAVLEIDAVPEVILTPLFAESLGLSPAAGRLRPASPEALRALPSDLAARHRIFPLELRPSAREGTPDTLVVATSEPLPPAVEEDLGFALAVALELRAAPLARILQAQGEYYGLPVERRSARITARLDGRAGQAAGASARPPVAEPVAAPPAARGAGSSRATIPGFAVPVPQSDPLAAEPEAPPHVPTLVPPGLPASEAPTLIPPTPVPEVPPTPVPSSSPTPIPEALPTPVPSSSPTPIPAALPTPVPSSSPTPIPEALHAPEPLSSPTPIPEALHAPEPLSPPTRPPTARPARAGARALGGWLQRALAEQEGPAPATPPPAHEASPRARSSRPAPPRLAPAPPRARRRGPYTVAMAEEDLARAETTDAVLEVVFDFAQQYFEYTALFAAQGDAVQGRRAAGAGASSAEVTALRLALSAPGALAEARELRAPRVAPLAPGGADAELARALRRSAPAAAAVVPVSVRGRVVAMIYGDDGDTPVELAEIGDLIALSALASPVLERVILKRKLSREGRLPTAPPPPVVKLAPAPPPPDDIPSGPLSARTRAALLQELREHHGDADERRTPSAAWPAAQPAPPAEPPAEPDDGRPIDAVAAAFGLRGTGVEDLEPASLGSIAGRLHHAAPAPPAGPRPPDIATAPTIEMPAARAPDDDHDPPWGIHPGAVPDRMPALARGTARADAGGRALLGRDYPGLVQTLVEGGEAAPRAFGELIRGGEPAVKAVAARFPGPLYLDRRIRELLAGSRGGEEIQRLPPASECGPLLELLIAFRRLSLPFMTGRAASPDPEIRLWATHVLGELRYPESANALLPRLFDDDSAIRRVARRSAAALVRERAGGSSMPPSPEGRNASASGAPILQGLEYVLRSQDESLPRKLMAIEAAASIRARALVPALKTLLSDPHEFLAEAAARAINAIPHDEGKPGAG